MPLQTINYACYMAIAGHKIYIYTRLFIFKAISLFANAKQLKVECDKLETMLGLMRLALQVLRYKIMESIARASFNNV